WTTENSAIVTVIGNGKDATVTAKNNGQTYVTVTHPNAENPKRVLCYVAETEEELFNYKLIYTEKSFYNIVAGSSETIYLSSINIEETEFSKVRWASSNTNVVTVAVGANNMEGIITGVSAGKTIVSASLAGVSDPVEFEITVYPEGTDLSVLPSPIYFTTSQNLLQFSVLNVNKTATVTPVQMPVSSYPGIKWEIENPSIADVIPNGRTATITSRSEGITRIHVSHLDAENTIPITVRVGEDYIISNPNTPFITASQDVVSLLSGASGVQITASLQNAPASDSFEWQIDDFTVATISSVGNKCFIVPKSVGQARITISHPDSVYDKQVLVLVQNTLEDLSAIPYLTTAQNVVQIATGTQQTITVRLKNNENLTTGFDWKSDNPHSLQIIASGQTAVFKGIQPGVARVTVSHSSCSFPLEIIATIADNSSDASLNPYITTPQNIVTVTKGSTSKSVNMTLVGGKESDNQHFLWTVDRSGIINLTSNGNNAVIKGTATGECRIIVSHPKATYSFPIVVVVEEPAPTSNLYINPSQPILTLKPADKEQTVTATLVGGTAEDKYGFTWYADNYNVIDLTYSANTAIIIPKQEGIAKITITHPKAAYDGQITVRITEYSTFAFAQPSMTITEGTTQFVSMQVPAMENDYGGRVVYSTNNEKIVTITGTNKVAQLTGVGAGTAIVAATSPSGAKSELMVYVKQAPAATQPHITCSINVISMKVTDNQRSLTATLVGTDVVATDQYNLSWEVENPSVAALVGSTGSTVLIKPIAAGETTVNISHPKTDTMFTIHVEVTSVNNGISLNKNYVALETGKTIEISATIDNGTVDDYKKITWSADKVNNEDLVSILGSGKTVAVYGIKSGQTQLTAEFNGQKVKCDMIIEASRQFNFEIQTMRIQPGQTKSFKYNLVPDDTPINWMASTNDYVTYAVDTVSKTVTVTGISEGTGSAGTVTKLTGIANSMTASVSITCAWDYKLTLGKSMIKGEPRQDPAVPDKFIIPYEVNPADAKVEVQVTKDIVTYVVDTAKKQIILTPVGEGDATLMVSAINTYNGTRFATQNCSINLLYNNLTVIPTVISKNGNFSKYYSEGGMLILGDGENMTLRFSIAEGNVNYSIDNLKFTKASSSSPDLSLTKPSADVWNIAHPTDYLEYEYLITQDSWLEYEGKRIGINWKRYKDGRDYYWYVDLGFNNSIFGKVA
ncbi:hypothetical protein LJC14_07285, partial [Treponema sp. OttesenSCG-928-L16]|nr:hypothetical protein [Treponema sp. OttesenSCG-928-L16]